MDYVCKVVGNLIINDINLELGYMEIIDLTTDDFKSSPQLREALRNRHLEVFDPSKHQNARRRKSISQIRNLTQDNKSNTPVKISSEGKLIKESLDNLCKKMDGLVNRINVLIDKSIESNNRLADSLNQSFTNKTGDSIDTEKFNIFLSKNLEYHDKIDKILNKKNNETDNKIDKLIDKLDQFITKGMVIGSHGISSNLNNSNKIKKYNDFDDKVTFVPDINIDSVEKANIKAEQIQQEGTDDIIAKLKAMKNNK
jgi:hypothetical protein